MLKDELPPSPIAPAMLLRLRLLLTSLGGGVLLLLILCLGAQNLEERPTLRLGIGRSAPCPAASWWGWPWRRG